MDVRISLILVIILQSVCVSKHQVVYFTYIQLLYVNDISMKLFLLLLKYGLHGAVPGAVFESRFCIYQPSHLEHIPLPCFSLDS